MQPEHLVEELRRTLGDRLLSVVLYGSAAAGDHTGKRSDYNILVVVDPLGVAELATAAKPAEKWRRAGNPPPLFLTMRQLRQWAGVFPIELLDIRESRRILFGPDMMDGIEVDDRHLRFVVERELKTALIRLQEGFLATGGRPGRVADLMIDSLATVLVLFRAALRVLQGAAPAPKLEALAVLGTHIPLDEGVFREIERLKEGKIGRRDIDALALFDRYLSAVESVVEKFDGAAPGAG